MSKIYFINRKRDKRVKELEAMQLNNNTAKVENFKFFQKDPEENTESMTLLLKSKLEETNKINKNLKAKTRKLEEKLKLYEDCKINYNSS